jgi:hypothetical protein
MPFATIVIVAMGTDDISNTRCNCEHIVSMIPADYG